MQQTIIRFIIDPLQIEDIFKNFIHKNPFSLKSEYKFFRKYFQGISEEEIIGNLSLEIQSSIKGINPKNYFYYCKKQHKIAIVKFRIKDVKSNSGKSGGWRVVALVDYTNNLFYLLSLYKHSCGKDNLTSQEKIGVKNLCEEYFESIR